MRCLEGKNKESIMKNILEYGRKSKNMKIKGIKKYRFSIKGLTFCQ